MIVKTLRGRKGFTLLELIVVVGIIGLFLSVVVGSIISLRATARDRRRIADLRQIQNALELYRSENAFYPTSLSPLNPMYIPVVPVDPRTGTAYVYRAVGGSGIACPDYHLAAVLEGNDPALTTDLDALPIAVGCSVGEDFHGLTPDCVALSSAAPDRCYDLKP